MACLQASGIVTGAAGVEVVVELRSEQYKRWTRRKLKVTLALAGDR